MNCLRVCDLIQELENHDPNDLVKVCRETLDEIIYYDIESLETVRGNRTKNKDGSLRIDFNDSSSTKTCLVNVKET